MVKPKPKFRSKAGRIRNPKKVTRWAKGDSCLSNPETTKFRDEASSLYYHQVVKNPLLTVKNVGGRHLAGAEDDSDDGVLSADVQSLTVSDARTGFGGSFASYKTFASDWSKCSNGAFEKFLGTFRMDSALHKEMLSILAATTEVINRLGGSHRETEYFASFVTMLEKCDPSQYHAMLVLLSIVAGRVPEAVLRKTFSTIEPKLTNVMAYAVESLDKPLMSVTCNALKKILSAQDGSIFETELPVQSLVYALLRIARDESPKLRRKARVTIGFILSRQKEKGEYEGVAKLVIGWIMDQLATYPTSGAKSAGDAIGLLQFIWSGGHVDSLSSGGRKKLYESVLRVMSSGEMSLVKIGFSFFSSVFQNQDKTQKDEEIIKKLLSALWDFRPDWRNNEAFLLWLHSVCDGLIRLVACGEIEFAGTYVPSLMESVSQTWSATWGSVPTGIFIQNIFHILRPETSNETIDNCFSLISKNLISIPPNPNALDVLSGLLSGLQPSQFTISGREVLLQLLQLRNSAVAPRVNSILAQFLKAFGIDNLWISVEPGIRHTVILPLVKDNLSGGEIAYWKENIFPLLQQPQYVADVWTSLVGFCRDPVDPQNFPAELVGKTIVEKPKYRLIALSALRQLALWPQSKPTLQKYGNNYLPLLFNLYLKERVAAIEAKKNKEVDEVNMGHADAIGMTITEYLPHLQLSFVHDLISRAIKKLDEGSEAEKGGILDLLTFLSVFEMDERTSNKIYEISAPLISEPAQMKRGYRLLHSLIKNTVVPEHTKRQVVDLLRQTKAKTKSNAEALRLECINSLLFLSQEWLTEFLPEAVLSLLSVNTKARKIAKKFVSQLCDSLKEGNVNVDSVEAVVKLGLESANAFIVSSTIHFLIEVYAECPPAHPQDPLLKACIHELLKESPDTAICREALAFISLNLSIFKSEMGPYGLSVGKILQESATPPPRKEMNKILARMIKVFGMAGLKAVLPNPDDPKISTRIKNIRRKLKKMKEMKAGLRKKEEGTNFQSDDENSDDDEVGFRSTSRRTAEKLIMKEGVVDFLDPRNITASLINKPKERKQEDCKWSSDGKLIIEEEKRGKKRSLEEEIEEIGGDGDDLSDEDELRIGKKMRGRGSSAASKRSSAKSAKSLRSVKSWKTASKKSNAESRHPKENRVQLKGKRRKDSSAQSVRSRKSTKSKGKSERFNYKR